MILWHSNVYIKHWQLLERLELDIDAETSDEARKLTTTLHELDHYIRTNQSSIPNYGDHYRNGDPISSAVAESSVNQIISKRFVKKQQMRKIRRNAHLFLTNTEAGVGKHLNGDLPALVAWHGRNADCYRKVYSSIIQHLKWNELLIMMI